MQIKNNKCNNLPSFLQKTEQQRIQREISDLDNETMIKLIHTEKKILKEKSIICDKNDKKSLVEEMHHLNSTEDDILLIEVIFSKNLKRPFHSSQIKFNLK